MRPTSTGTLLPLFDCFLGAPETTSDCRSLDAAGVQQSVQRDLVRLFNVRNGLTIEAFLGEGLTALDYGLPDTLSLSPQSANDLQQWERVIARALALYEPRLSDVRVTVRPDPSKPSAAHITLSAKAVQGRQLCQVQFDLVLDDRAACCLPYELSAGAENA